MNKQKFLNKEWESLIKKTEYDKHSTDQRIIFTQLGEDSFYKRELSEEPNIGEFNIVNVAFKSPKLKTQAISLAMSSIKLDKYKKVFVVLPDSEYFNYDAAYLASIYQRELVNTKPDSSAIILDDDSTDIIQQVSNKYNHIIIVKETVWYDNELNKFIQNDNYLDLVIFSGIYSTTKSNSIDIFTNNKTKISHLTEITNYNNFTGVKPFEANFKNLSFEELIRLINNIDKELYYLNKEEESKKGLNTIKQTLLTEYTLINEYKNEKEKFSDIMINTTSFTDRFRKGTINLALNKDLGEYSLTIKATRTEEIDPVLVKKSKETEIIEKTKSYNRKEKIENILNNLVDEYEELTTKNKDNYKGRSYLVDMISKINSCTD